MQIQIPYQHKEGSDKSMYSYELQFYGGMLGET